MRWLTVLLMGVLVGFLALPAVADHTDEVSYSTQVGETFSLFDKWRGGGGGLEGMTSLRADPPGIVEFETRGAPPSTVLWATCIVAGRTTVTMKYTRGGKEHTLRIAITCVAETEK